MLVDAHAHLNDESLFDKAAELVDAYRAKGVGLVINGGYDLPSSQRGKELAERFSDCYFTVGMHPHDSRLADENMYDAFKTLASHPKAVAIGEIGLDYHYDLSPRDVQAREFVRQLELADSLKLPVVIHLREAYEDFNRLLKDNRRYVNNGILLHCYSGSAELAAEVYNEYGAYYSFGGALTFSKHKDKVLAVIPRDRLLLETDCPYMTPVPLRGTPNSPANLPLIRDKMAELTGLQPSEIEEMTTENAKNFYRI